MEPYQISAAVQAYLSAGPRLAGTVEMLLNATASMEGHADAAKRLEILTGMLREAVADFRKSVSE